MKTLLLDLDETLVHSSFIKPDSFDAVFMVDYNKRQLPVYVNVRPFVQRFLKEMSKCYEIMIFTASIAKYADKVIDFIDPHKFIKYRLYRTHCTFLNGNFVKDISRIG
jgi:carboxy-terminal domain RNA polymerase II polypeptide A small phosphatase